MDQLFQQYSNLSSHAVEVKVQDTNGKYYLPDDSVLREKEVVGIFIMENPNDNAKSILGRALVSETVLRSSYLHIVDVADRILDEHPMMDLAVGKADRSVRSVKLPDFNPTKSYITFTGTASDITVGESYMVHFWYIDK